MTTTTQSVTERGPLLNVLAPTITDPKTKLASKILEDQSHFTQRKLKDLTITVFPPQNSTTAVPPQPPLQPDLLHDQQIDSPLTEKRPQDSVVRSNAVVWVWQPDGSLKEVTSPEVTSP